jgi:high-affinity nickel permease
MFGLDERIAAIGTGEALLLVMVVAVLLGLRHATDPDHLTAVSTLVAGERDRTSRRATTLGFAWGLGHGTTPFLFGLPIVLFDDYLPESFTQAAEVLIGIVIAALALRLLVRWRRGHFHAHEHVHHGVAHRHLHQHETHAPLHDEEPHHHDHVVALGRSPWASYGIGLVHGIGGSAGVGILLLASVQDELVGVTALLLFAVFTALSMTLASAVFGSALVSGPLQRRFSQLAPALGVASLAFGVWYGLGALEAVPYYF